LGAKDVAKGYLTPEELNESWSFTFRPKMAASVLEESIVRSFNNSQGLEIGSRVLLTNLKLALWGVNFGCASGFMGGGFGALLEVRRTLVDLFLESFELKQKAELVQISIQTHINTVG
jgi:hypothetical protein